VTRRESLSWLSGGLLAWLTLAAPMACRRRSPEERVRDTIAALERGVEDEDLKAIRKLVSERYRDAEQQDRAAALALLQMYFARSPNTHLLTRVAAVDIEPGAGYPAHATVVVAMASFPIENADDAVRANADVFRFDLTLVEEGGQWVVTGAAWQAAAPKDL
jgi:hypothetical protein